MVARLRLIEHHLNSSIYQTAQNPMGMLKLAAIFKETAQQDKKSLNK
jgi:hypothetical protein